MYKAIILETKFRDSNLGLRCTTYVNGAVDRSTGCSGYGYDMRGTALAQVLSKYTPILERAKKLLANYGSEDNTNGYYGLRFWKNKESLHGYEDGATVSVNGACGHSSIERIARACDISINNTNSTGTGDTYIISWEDSSKDGQDLLKKIEDPLLQW